MDSVMDYSYPGLVRWLSASPKLTLSILSYSNSGKFGNAVPKTAFSKYTKRGYDVGVSDFDQFIQLVITEPPCVCLLRALTYMS